MQHNLQFECFIEDGVESFADDFGLDNWNIRIVDARNDFDDSKGIAEPVRVERNHLLGADH